MHQTLSDEATLTYAVILAKTQTTDIIETKQSLVDPAHVLDVDHYV